MNDKDTIKWLKKHNENAFKKHNILEIEELKEVVVIEKEEYESLKEENQKLINVLRRIRLDLMFDYKALNIKKLNSNDLTDNYWLGYIHACEEVFDRINELKESDK